MAGLGDKAGLAMIWLLLPSLLGGCSRRETSIEAAAQAPPAGTSPVEAPAADPASAVSASAAELPPAKAAAPYCRSATELGPGPRPALDPDPGLGAARRVWRGDLDGDGLEDLLLRFPDACGNYGDCPYGVYLACGPPGEGDRAVYRPVWGPDYSFELAVEENAAASEAGWRTLIDTQRDGRKISRRRLAFTGDRYEIVETLD